MVDYTNESTVSIPPENLRIILVIQRRDYVIEAIEAYVKEIAKGGYSHQEPTYIIRARLFSLFLEVRALLKRSVKPEEFKLLAENIESDEFLKLRNCFYFIDEELDKKKITRVDTRQAYDRTRVEEEAGAYGLK